MSEYSRCYDIDYLQKEARVNHSAAKQLADHYLNEAKNSQTKEEMLFNGKECFKYSILYIKLYKEYFSKDPYAIYPSELSQAEDNIKKLFITMDEIQFTKNKEAYLNRFIQQIEVIRIIHSKNNITDVNESLFLEENKISISDEYLLSIQPKTNGCQIC